MTENEEPAPDPVVADGSRLPVPAGRVYPVRAGSRWSGRIGSAVERVRPALPAVIRGAAMAATVTASAVVAAKMAKAGARLPQPSSLPGPLPARVSPDLTRDLVSSRLPAAPDMVVVSRVFVSWTRVEVYRRDSFTPRW